MTTANFVRQLATEDEPLKYSRLLQLSGLTADETAEFKMAWPSVPQRLKREVLAKLVELSEDNLELDFTSVFMACLDDADADVREAATQGLWECEDRVIIRPLIGLLADDPSATVRAAAAASLGRFAAMAHDGKLLTSDAERIRSALMDVIEMTDEELEVRRRAIEALATLEVPEIEVIIRGAYDSGVMELKQTALYAMGRTSNTKWLPTVLSEMDHKDGAVRFEAATAAGQLGEESSVPHLIRLIQDEDPEVQLAAVGALGAIGGTLAKAALQRCLRIGDEALEEAARAALSELEFDDDPLGIRFEV